MSTHIGRDGPEIRRMTPKPDQKRDFFEVENQNKSLFNGGSQGVDKHVCSIHGVLCYGVDVTFSDIDGIS
jgi:hypothetical protein